MVHSKIALNSTCTCFKTELQKGITHISSSSDYIWCKLDKTFFNFDQDVFICAIYIPPRDSPYFDPDTFHNLENDIPNLSEDGHVILTGDFNARTACALDFIDSDDCVHIPGDNLDLPCQNLKRRKNFDNHINEHGNCLLDICKTCDLRILNGRSKGDSFGKITYHSRKGISTVDYFIVSHNMLNLVDNVIVKKPTIFSDHSQIICSINTLSPVSIHNETEPLIETFNLPKQFLWENNSREKFVDTILSDEFQSRLLMFEQTHFDHTQDGINLATQTFSDLLNEIPLRSPKLNCQNKDRKKQHSKKWFDQECFQC